MSLAALAAPAAVVLLALGLAACESTQEKSARLAKNGGNIASEKGIVVTKRNAAVTVGKTAVFGTLDQAVAVVELRNTSAKPLADVPIALNVLGKGGKSVFKNNDPGIEASLTHAPLIPAHGQLVWVNDQVTPISSPKRVKAVVGAATASVPDKVPVLDIASKGISVDPVNGAEVNGRVTNRSTVEQRKLIVFAVARKGSKIVAAGRGQVNRLTGGKSAPFHVFFIGNPRGAKLSLAAPPTVLR